MQTLLNAGNSQGLEIPQGKNAQVETISREKLAWLGGLIDGEGHIGGGLHKNQGYRVYVTITNSCPFTIRNISEIYNILNIKYCFCLARYNNPTNYKDVITVSVQGHGSVKKLLEVVFPYLVAKSNQAKIVIDYITFRKSLGYGQLTIEKRITLSSGWDKFITTLKFLNNRSYDLTKLSRKASRPLELQGLTLKANSTLNDFQRKASQPLHWDDDIV